MKNPAEKFECLACGHTDFRMSNKPVGDLEENGCPNCQGDMIVRENDDLPKRVKEIGETVEDVFNIWDFAMTKDQMEFRVDFEENAEESFEKFTEKIESLGYFSKIERENEEVKILIKKQPKIGESNVLINIILFLATIGTTAGVAGYWGLYGPDLGKAVMFSFSILTILGAHELGHKFTAMKNNVKASWPYFLPVPHPWIGTFGAVIKNKSPIPNKNALVEIGASGPIIGYCMAIPFTIIGLTLSSSGGGASEFAQLPKPLIFYLLSHLAIGSFPPSFPPHPFAWAGFLGIFVTALNLLPTGQLDGGHIARSLLNQETHFILTRAIGFALIISGLLWPGFAILGVLVLFFIGKPHPGPLNDISGLSTTHKILAITAVVILIISFPLPF